MSLKRGALFEAIPACQRSHKAPRPRPRLGGDVGKLAAELESEQLLLNAFLNLNLRPFCAAPEALNLRAVTEGVQGTCSRQTNSPGNEPGLSKRPSGVLRGNAVRAARSVMTDYANVSALVRAIQKTIRRFGPRHLELARGLAAAAAVFRGNKFGHYALKLASRTPGRLRGRPKIEEAPEARGRPQWGFLVLWGDLRRGRKTPPHGGFSTRD